MRDGRGGLQRNLIRAAYETEPAAAFTETVKIPRRFGRHTTTSRRARRILVEAPLSIVTTADRAVKPKCSRTEPPLRTVSVGRSGRLAGGR